MLSIHEYENGRVGRDGLDIGSGNLYMYIFNAVYGNSVMKIYIFQCVCVQMTAQIVDKTCYKTTLTGN